MIKRNTWILLIIFSVVVISYFAFNSYKSNSTGVTVTSTPGNSYLVSQNEGALQSIQIFNDQHVFQMQRNGSGAWVITLPTAGIADPSLAGAVETQIDALLIIKNLNDQFNLSAAGLTPPTYTIGIVLTGGKSHVIQVGSMTPSGSGYYVHFDDQNLYIVSSAGIDALLNLLTAPPYPPTPTPIPTTSLMVTPQLMTPTP